MPLPADRRMSDVPRIERVRHELRRRTLDVLRVETLGPSMLRVVLGGAELEGFTSLGFDDHVKLIFPTLDGAQPQMRDFTPRRYDAAKGELAIDFFVHEAGPATSWARDVVPGSRLIVGGPKGSAVIAPEGIDVHVLIGDETAVPAIARRLEELPESTRALVFVESDSGRAWLPLPSRADVETHWIAREKGAGAPARELIAAIEARGRFDPRTFWWIAAESQTARALRRHLRDARAVPLAWIKASGYWQRGAAGAHESIADDATNRG
jgi:NADPH-dependent ferric siderophore reductase